MVPITPPPILFIPSKPSNMEHSLRSSLILMLVIFPSLIQLHKPIQAGEENHYQECKRPFSCANVDSIGYPFYDGDEHAVYCGHPGFELDCSGDRAEISMPSMEQFYLVNYNSTSQTITVARKDYWDTYCPQQTVNTEINVTFFHYTSMDVNITLYYQCSAEATFYPHYFYCPGGINGGINGYFMPSAHAPGPAMTPGPCAKNVVVPVYETAAARLTDNSSLQGALQSGFELEWDADNELCDQCIGSGGVCGYNTDLYKFACYCADSTQDVKCNGDNDIIQIQNSGKSSRKTVLIAITASFSALGTGMLIILSFYVIRRCSKNDQVLEVTKPKTNQEVEAFLRGYGTSGPRRYTYTELKRITNSFKDKLGEGGYGMVYKGKLQNGQLVAVKVLKKSNGDAMEFINEVASIGRTNHKNIVRLLGFCYKGHRWALVYDFMPNGSLEKFIYGRDNHQSLTWKTLFDIAIGIARGLGYLHQGCNTRILHFDIKPHNILLDENFCPKISDFGLAKSCPQKESIISLSGARGTVGYIAPEVFMRSFGGVSQKSDVYSYGMLVLEMVGCRKNSGAKVECSSEQYFPHWIYKQLEEEEKLEHQGTMTIEERELWRKMVVVSLWCIQIRPQSRPTVTGVVEMLEGTSESLQIPPMPSPASPPRSLSEQNSSFIHTLSIS